MANKDNPRKGALFEAAVQQFLANSNIATKKSFVVEIGANGKKRCHKFDLGSDSPKLVVECKSHSWTDGGNAPSAKLAVWNEAMYYFSLVPVDYQKMLFVLLSRFEPEGETLLQYYVRRFEHLIPSGVEIWEFDEMTAMAKRMYPINSPPKILSKIACNHF